MRADEPLLDWTWVGSHLDDIAFRTAQHLALAGIAVAIGFAIAFALSIWAVRNPRIRGPLTAFAGGLYTIPSLALFAALVPFTGFSILTAEIPLVLYTQQILIRNIVAGFDAVPIDVLEAADGMGYSRRERLSRVELPLAVPLIVTGIRLAAVTMIGLVMVLTLIGDNFGGLGLFIKEGIQTFFATKVYVGAILSVTLAVLVDLILVRVERRLTPWAAARAQGGAAVTSAATPARA
ncbi:MAG: ABC transporter permease [Chloroflexota bacterium]